MKNSFVLYTEYAKHLELLSMEQRGVLFTAIMAFETGEEMPDMDGMTKMAFSFISEQLLRDKEKYESICKKRSAAGQSGGRPKANADEEKQSDDSAEEKKQVFSESDEEKQELSEESKKSKCFSEKANESNEKQKNPDNEDEDEYEDEYEHEDEDEDKREVKKEGECEGEKENPPSLDLSPGVVFIPGLSEFLHAFPNVVVDNRSSPSLDLDFAALSEAFMQSSWLRKRPHDLSWVARNEQKIIGGTYKDHESADVYGEIRQELLREETLNDA